MFDFDLSSWAGITAATAIIVAISKFAFKKYVDGHEPKLAILFGLVLGISAKLAGVMTFKAGGAGWIQAVTGGVVAGVLSQVAYDKLAATLTSNASATAVKPEEPKETPKDISKQ